MCKRCQAAWRRRGYSDDGPCAPVCARTVDELVVEMAVSTAVGDRDVPVLNPAERAEAVAILTRRGWSAGAIAGRLRCTKRTVVRHRTALRAAQGPADAGTARSTDAD